MRDDLIEELRLHLAAPFPESVEKGTDYGEVDPVMIDADIYGWASRADSLTPDDRKGLRRAMEELERSLSALPADAQPYYERLVRISRLALS